MADAEETWGEERQRQLEVLLIALSDRIRELAERGELLAQAGELMRLIGDVKSELFHYEVRITYDTPEVADSRRIVTDAQKPDDPAWEPTTWTPEEEDEPEW